MLRSWVSVEDSKMLTKLRELVGGAIEVIPLKGFRYLVLNADGKLEGLPPNPIATKLAHDSESICPSDFIAGNAVIVPAHLLED